MCFVIRKGNERALRDDPTLSNRLVGATATIEIEKASPVAETDRLDAVHEASLIDMSVTILFDLIGFMNSLSQLYATYYAHNTLHKKSSTYYASQYATCTSM